MTCRRHLTILTALVLLALGAGAAPAPHAELAIGAAGPAFNLKGTDGQMHSLADLAGKAGTAVVFTCNHCPFSQGYEDRLIELAHTYQPRGIAFVAINPNDPKLQPQDSFEEMVKRAAEKHFPYPYLMDGTQQVASAYGARVTPHVFLLDANGKLVYRGRIDDALKKDEVTKHEFKDALAALVKGQPVPVAETKAFGCGVKWSHAGS